MPAFATPTDCAAHDHCTPTDTARQRPAHAMHVPTRADVFLDRRQATGLSCDTGYSAAGVTCLVNRGVYSLQLARQRGQAARGGFHLRPRSCRDARLSPSASRPAVGPTTGRLDGASPRKRPSRSVADSRHCQWPSGGASARSLGVAKSFGSAAGAVAAPCFWIRFKSFIRRG